MAKKGYTPKQIIGKPREAEVLLSQGVTIAVVSKEINQNMADTGENGTKKKK